MTSVDGSVVADQQESESHIGEEQLEEFETSIQARIADAVSSESFDEWYRELEFRRNILEGTPYFNGPSSVQSPRRHSPSSLLQCKRKTAYKQLNAPEESEDPNGIFWFGSHFETDLIVPFLQESVTGEHEYVANSLWVDFTVETDVGEIRVKGETDPVIVDSDAEPLLLTEIKTKQTVGDLDSPNQHHKAQAHAYMKGLSEKYDRNIDEALIVYGSRKNLNLTAFHIEFDPWFWSETILDWIKTHSTYRLKDELPPADPSFDWECTFCSYRERCGEGDREFRNSEATGLLPHYTGYPRQKVVEYLESYEDAKLTPSLAVEYPPLAEEHGVYDWRCRNCNTRYHWDEVDWDGDVTSRPRCSVCSQQDTTSLLAGPSPDEQPIEEANS